MKISWKALLPCAFALCLLPACGTPARPESATAPHNASATTNAPQPLPAETNPPGDIPDTQVFVPYASPNGYSVSFPEGWQRTEQGRAVTFINGFDGERVRLAAPARSASQLATAGFEAVRDVRTSPANLPAGRATLITFTSNSQPNALTGKRVRLLNNSYVISSPHATALLDLWAPLGSDNVDQWRRISRSFRWR
jgi:hypothetical protein